MKHRIVVLGAGYTGANAAGRLARLLHPEDVTITLVNAVPEFVERVRSHQWATGQDLPRRDLREVFAGTGVDVRLARVTAVDADRRSVAVVDDQGSDEIGYDTLIYALGSVATAHGVPGVAEHGFDIAGKQSALRLHDRLGALAPGATVAVVGGGLTGIEAATEIAEARPDLAVTMITNGDLGARLSAKGRRHLRKVFDRLAITVLDNTDVARVEPDGVRIVVDRLVPADITVWTTGFAVHPIAAASTLAVADTGQIVVDDTMRSVSHPDVYAVGDAGIAAGPGGKPLRMSCASGVPMAWQAADAVAARLTGREVPRNTIRYVQQCISLGRRDGLIQLVSADDQPKSFVLTGGLAAKYKEFICKGAAWTIDHPTALLPVRRRRVTAAPVTV